MMTARRASRGSSWLPPKERLAGRRGALCASVVAVAAGAAACAVLATTVSAHTAAPSPTIAYTAWVEPRSALLRAATPNLSPLDDDGGGVDSSQQRADDHSPAVAPWWAAPPASGYGVIILEPRAHPALRWLINDTLAKLPPTWAVVLYHHAQNAEFARRQLAPLLVAGGAGGGGRLRLLQHEDDVSAQPPRNNGWVNGVLGSPLWWRRQPFDRFLLLHVDSVICRADDWDFLRELSQYDYAGSPWGDRHAIVMNLTDGHGGNGGFSWRARDAALAVLEARGGLHGADEDVFFSREIGGQGDLRMAPLNVSCRFGVETWLCDAAPFGVHKAWAFLQSERWAALAAPGGACPAAAIVAELARAALPAGE
jgi:hypothetical protein